MSTDTENQYAGHDQTLVSLPDAMSRVLEWAMGDRPSEYKGWHQDICEVLVSVRVWKPVAEELPPVEKPVLVWTGDHSAIARRTEHNGGGWISRDIAAMTPTHWQSLPDGPV